MLANLVAWQNKVHRAVLGEDTFNGQPVQRDYSDESLFAAIYAGREVVLTADKVARALGADLPTRSGLVARRKAVVEWLKQIGPDCRMTAHEIRLSNRVQGLEATLRSKDEEITRMRGHYCRRSPGTPCEVAAPYGEPGVLKLLVTEAEAARLTDASRNNLHPSAKDANRANTSERLQLQRIESLSKQAASRSSAPAFWLGAFIAAVTIGLCHTLWG